MASIQISDLTSGSLNGTGAFDVLMQATTAHLQAELEEGRITGQEYATVYLGSIQTAMQQALQFVLNSQASANQAALIHAQTINTEKQTLLTLEQRNQVVAQTTATKAEILGIEARAALTEQQVVTEAYNSKLIAKQLDKLDVDIDLVSAETTNTKEQRTNLIRQQQNLNAQTLRTNAERENIILTRDTITKQQEKLTSEIALLAQKKITEQAQTQDVTTGLVGKQQGLYQAQTDGFQRNAEHKAADLLARTWHVQRTTDEAIQPGSAGMANDRINQAIEQMLMGIGITPVPPTVIEE